MWSQTLFQGIFYALMIRFHISTNRKFFEAQDHRLYSSASFQNKAGSGSRLPGSDLSGEGFAQINTLGPGGETSVAINGRKLHGRRGERTCKKPPLMIWEESTTTLGVFSKDLQGNFVISQYSQGICDKRHNRSAFRKCARFPEDTGAASHL